MDLWHSFSGMVQLEITSADPESALQKLSAQGIELYHVSFLSEVAVEFLIKRDQLKKLELYCVRQGDSVTLRRKVGLFWTLRELILRPVLMMGCLFFVLLVVCVPSRILFVRVEGNSAVPEKRILEAANQAGIHFGSSRRAVRSEKVKNALLEAVPQLQWAGVNTYGCTAVVSVRERSVEPEDVSQSGVSGIIAAVDGVVYSCTASRGTLLCREGEAVTKGQVLISGYTDCGICIRADNAEGEVYALTNRTITAVTPAEHIQITGTASSNKKYSLLIGKKRIKLWKDSGNWDSSCGRMYKEYYITLPGGFQLPLGIAVDTIEEYEISPTRIASSEAESLLRVSARRYVTDSMVASSIKRESVQVLQKKTVYMLTGSYICTEMIGRVKQEQIGDIYGKSN